MKKLLALISVAAILSGCTTVNKTDACLAAQTAYGIYLAIISADGQPSEDQILAARAAAIVLQQQCGWVPPAAQKSRTNVKRIDANGVLILHP